LVDALTAARLRRAAAPGARSAGLASAPWRVPARAVRAHPRWAVLFLIGFAGWPAPGFAVAPLGL